MTNINKYISLHKISEILIDLLKETIAKSKKHPNEAKVVDQLIKEFLQKKIEEIYGMGQMTSAIDEDIISKEEAQNLILEMLNKKGIKKKTAETEAQLEDSKPEIDSLPNQPENAIKDKSLEEVQEIRRQVIAQKGDASDVGLRLKPAAKPENPSRKQRTSGGIPTAGFRGGDMNIAAIAKALGGEFK